MQVARPLGTCGTLLPTAVLLVPQHDTLLLLYSEPACTLQCWDTSDVAPLADDAADDWPQHDDGSASGATLLWEAGGVQTASDGGNDHPFAFTLDGTQFVYANHGEDAANSGVAADPAGALVVRRTADGTQVGCIAPLQSPWRCCSFSRDGTRLVAANAEDVHVLQLPRAFTDASNAATCLTTPTTPKMIRRIVFCEPLPAIAALARSEVVFLSPSDGTVGCKHECAGGRIVPGPGVNDPCTAVGYQWTGFLGSQYFLTRFRPVCQSSRRVASWTDHIDEVTSTSPSFAAAPDGHAVTSDVRHAVDGEDVPLALSLPRDGTRLTVRIAAVRGVPTIVLGSLRGGITQPVLHSCAACVSAPLDVFSADHIMAATVLSPSGDWAATIVPTSSGGELRFFSPPVVPPATALGECLRTATLPADVRACVAAFGRLGDVQSRCVPRAC